MGPPCKPGGPHVQSVAAGDQAQQSQHGTARRSMAATGTMAAAPASHPAHLQQRRPLVFHRDARQLAEAVQEALAQLTVHLLARHPGRAQGGGAVWHGGESSSWSRPKRC